MNSDNNFNRMDKTANNMMGCGCLLTLFITIPIIIIVLLALF